MAIPLTIESSKIANPAPATFDYTTLAPDLADRLKAQAAHIRARIRKATADIIEIGNDLVAAKQHLEHGQFLDWLEVEIGIAARTAQAYMNIARLAEGKCATIALLPPTTVHRLAAKSAPAAIVNQVITRAESGEIISDDSVKAMLAEAAHGGRSPRQKGNRAERAIVAYLQNQGFAAERIPLSGAVGGSFAGDLTVPLLGVDRVAEVKVRANGFRQLYAWLDGRDLLIVRADRLEPLVILPLRLAAEIAAAAERSKPMTDRERLP